MTMRRGATSRDLGDEAVRALAQLHLVGDVERVLLHRRPLRWLGADISKMLDAGEDPAMRAAATVQISSAVSDSVT